MVNNASIGISCFVSMLFVLPGLITLTFNAVQLGTVFGFMFRPDLGDASVNFQNFVTAHGPFEEGGSRGLGWQIRGRYPFLCECRDLRPCLEPHAQFSRGSLTT